MRGRGVRSRLCGEIYCRDLWVELDVEMFIHIPDRRVWTVLYNFSGSERGQRHLSDIGRLGRCAHRFLFL